MKFVTTAFLLASCLVFQGCVHNPRPYEHEPEHRVVHHVVTPAPRHDVRPHEHHAPKPHVQKHAPTHHVQKHDARRNDHVERHNRQYKSGSETRPRHDRQDSKHLGQHRR